MKAPWAGPPRPPSAAAGLALLRTRRQLAAYIGRIPTRAEPRRPGKKRRATIAGRNFLRHVAIRQPLLRRHIDPGHIRDVVRSRAPVLKRCNRDLGDTRFP